MHQYKLISRKGEGTFSEVLKAQSLKTGNYVAIKCMKTHFNSVEQVNQLREIQALRKAAPHAHIVKLLEILYDEPTGRLALVFELMDINMYELIKDRKTYLSQSKVKYYMYQIFKAIDHLHKKGIFHRDIKPENILLTADLVKLADLGSCKGMSGEHPYTEYISTRWYRSPECLMTDGYYDHKMDIWGAGCVMFEILTLVPLFPGKNELDMIHRIHNIMGTPSQDVLDRFKSHASHLDFNFPQKPGTGIEKLLPHVTPECVDLLRQLLTYDPEKRISSDQVLQHEYFKELVEAERQQLFQTTFSTRVSPSSKQFQYSTLYSDDKSSTFHNEKSMHQQQQQQQQQQHHAPIGMKKQKKKPRDMYGHTNMSKFPSVNVNLKFEGSLKNSHTHDTSTEDEGGEKGFSLPPLKNQASAIQKKDDAKKLVNTMTKSSLMATQHIYGSKKNSKVGVGSMIPPEYMILGRKAS